MFQGKSQPRSRRNVWFLLLRWFCSAAEHVAAAKGKGKKKGWEGKTEPPRFVPEQNRGKHRHLAATMHPAQLGLLQRGHHLPQPPPFQQTAIFCFPFSCTLNFVTKVLFKAGSCVHYSSDCLTGYTWNPHHLETAHHHDVPKTLLGCKRCSTWSSAKQQPHI